MDAVSEFLPVTQVFEPESADEVCKFVRTAAEQGTAIYPIGGGTSLCYGLPARTGGIGISLRLMDQIVDYPASDMTITVGSGMTVARFDKTLAEHGQRMPVDVPQRETATLGGVVATNFSGPRRYGCGTLRDYLIGIEAVDAHGEKFKGGGRVVKNVAGYDFCRLLIGSLGTLGIITQLTFKLRPVVGDSRIVACGLRDWVHAERLLAALVESPTTPTAIEVVSGPDWHADETLGDLFGADLVAVLLVGLEGTSAEVTWMLDTLRAEWNALDTRIAECFTGAAAAELWDRLAEFPALPESALVLKATTVPSAVTEFARQVVEMDAGCSLQCHAGDGVTIMRFSEFPADGLARSLLARLAPLASQSRGNVTILSNASGAEMTHQSVWSGIDAPFDLMTAVKREFDPRNLLNPGRFVYT